MDTTTDKTVFIVLFWILLSSTIHHVYALDVNQALEDRILGDPKAQVTMYEYSSLTCPHCADFHAETLPLLREQYIDTGKMKLVYRDFPLDRLAVFATLLTRCMDIQATTRFYALIDTLFQEQDQWIRTPERLALRNLRFIGLRSGMSNQLIRECRNSQSFVDKLISQRYQFEQQFKISSTPTFIFNDNERRIIGNQPYDVFATVIDSLLEKNPNLPQTQPALEEEPSSNEKPNLYKLPKILYP